MTPDELRDTLMLSGLGCKTRGAEVVVATCVFCGNERHNLELNAGKGVYKCWACNSSGRLATFLTQVTGETHHLPVQLGTPAAKAPRPSDRQATTFQSQPVAAFLPAQRYLERRGIDLEIAVRYGLVVCTERGHLLEGRIAIPMLDYWTQQAVGWIGRTFSGARPKYLSTLPSKIITGWSWSPQRDDPAVVVEGHLDGIAVHRAGFPAAVLSGTGVLGIAEWAARLPTVRPVVVMLDGSAPAQGRRVYWTIQPLRGGGVHMVTLPVGDDPATVGPDYIREVVARVVKEASRYL